MFEILNKIVDFSATHTPGNGGPDGFLIFILGAFFVLMTFIVTYYVFDFLKHLTIQFTTWRTNVAEYDAKGKKNDVSPSIIEEQVEIQIKLDKLSEELKEGIIHLNEKIK